MRACVRACVRAYVRACVRVCVCACVRACVLVCACERPRANKKGWPQVSEAVKLLVPGPGGVVVDRLFINHNQPLPVSV